MDFNNKRLIAKYKTWVRVQVVFYDFIFGASMNMPTEKFNKIHVEQNMEEFADGGKIYEDAICKINELFETPEEAWEAFLNIEE